MAYPVTWDDDSIADGNTVESDSNWERYDSGSSTTALSDEHDDHSNGAAGQQVIDASAADPNRHWMLWATDIEPSTHVKVSTYVWPDLWESGGTRNEGGLFVRMPTNTSAADSDIDCYYVRILAADNNVDNDDEFLLEICVVTNNVVGTAFASVDGLTTGTWSGGSAMKAMLLEVEVENVAGRPTFTVTVDGTEEITAAADTADTYTSAGYSGRVLLRAASSFEEQPFVQDFTAENLATTIVSVDSVLNLQVTSGDTLAGEPLGTVGVVVGDISSLTAVDSKWTERIHVTGYLYEIIDDSAAEDFSNKDLVILSSSVDDATIGTDWIPHGTSTPVVVHNPELWDEWGLSTSAFTTAFDSGREFTYVNGHHIQLPFTITIVTIIPFSTARTDQLAHFIHTDLVGEPEIVASTNFFDTTRGSTYLWETGSTLDGTDITNPVLLFGHGYVSSNVPNLNADYDSVLDGIITSLIDGNIIATNDNRFSYAPLNGALANEINALAPMVQTNPTAVSSFTALDADVVVAESNVVSPLPSITLSALVGQIGTIPTGSTSFTALDADVSTSEVNIPNAPEITFDGLDPTIATYPTAGLDIIGHDSQIQSNPTTSLTFSTSDPQIRSNPGISLTIVTLDANISTIPTSGLSISVLAYQIQAVNPAHADMVGLPPQIQTNPAGGLSFDGLEAQILIAEDNTIDSPAALTFSGLDFRVITNVTPNLDIRGLDSSIQTNPSTGLSIQSLDHRIWILSTASLTIATKSIGVGVPFAISANEVSIDALDPQIQTTPTTNITLDARDADIRTIPIANVSIQGLEPKIGTPRAVASISGLDPGLGLGILSETGDMSIAGPVATIRVGVTVSPPTANLDIATGSQDILTGYSDVPDLENMIFTALDPTTITEIVLNIIPDLEALTITALNPNIVLSINSPLSNIALSALAPIIGAGVTVSVDTTPDLGIVSLSADLFTSFLAPVGLLQIASPNPTIRSGSKILIDTALLEFDTSNPALLSGFGFLLTSADAGVIINVPEPTVRSGTTAVVDLVNLSIETYLPLINGLLENVGLIEIKTGNSNIVDVGNEVSLTVYITATGTLYDPGDVYFSYYKKGTGGSAIRRMAFSAGEITRVSEGIYNVIVPPALTRNLVKGKYVVQWTADIK
jgi:hypothetical protein